MIFLPQIKGTVETEYELEYILLEGHCFDVSTGQPPRGLQFTLGTKNNPVMVDTIVMANLVSIQYKSSDYNCTLFMRILYQSLVLIVRFFEILFLEICFSVFQN